MSFTAIPMWSSTAFMSDGSLQSEWRVRTKHIPGSPISGGWAGWRFRSAMNRLLRGWQRASQELGSGGIGIDRPCGETADDGVQLARRQHVLLQVIHETPRHEIPQAELAAHA